MRGSFNAVGRSSTSLYDALSCRERAFVQESCCRPTTFRTARMCAGVVPQHPPTIDAPSSSQRFTRRAYWAGVASSAKLQPGVGSGLLMWAYAANGRSVKRRRCGRCAVMPSGGMQFRPVRICPPGEHPTTWARSACSKVCRAIGVHGSFDHASLGLYLVGGHGCGNAHEADSKK